MTILYRTVAGLSRTLFPTSRPRGKLDQIPAFGITCKCFVTAFVIAFALVFLAMLPAFALSAPVISPANNSFSTPQSVTMTASAGIIYFTTDGTVPSTASQQYSSAITISSPTQINAVAYQSGTYSAVTTAYIDVDPTLAPILQVNPILRLTGNFGVAATEENPVRVRTWTDLSGSGNSATGTWGTQPTVAQDASGIIAVSFNGTSQYLSLPSITAALQPYIFIVTKPAALTAGAGLIDYTSGAAGNDLLMDITTGSLGSYSTYIGTNYASGTSASSSPSAMVANQYQLLESAQTGASTASFYLNGTLGQTNSSMNNAGNVSRGSNFIGKAIDINGGTYYSGNIAEILVYNSSLSSAQIGAIEGYLMQKYQIGCGPEAPVISVPSATLNGPTQVVISRQPGAVTYFTEDGTTPSTSSPVYDGKPITVNYSQTIKAMAVKNNVQSIVTTASYTLDSSQWPAPSTSDMTSPTINLQLPAPSL